MSPCAPKPRRDGGWGNRFPRRPGSHFSPAAHSQPVTKWAGAAPAQLQRAAAAEPPRGPLMSGNPILQLQLEDFSWGCRDTPQTHTLFDLYIENMNGFSFGSVPTWSHQLLPSADAVGEPESCFTFGDFSEVLRKIHLIVLWKHSVTSFSLAPSSCGFIFFLSLCPLCHFPLCLEVAELQSLFPSTLTHGRTLEMERGMERERRKEENRREEKSKYWEEKRSTCTGGKHEEVCDLKSESWQ